MSDKRLKQRILTRLLYIFLLIFAFIQVFPLLWATLFSFKSNEDMVLKGALALPEKWMFSNYVNAWGKGHIQEYFFNSLFVAVVTLLAVVLLSSMAAYAIARMKWALSKATMTLLLAGMMVPVQAILIPQFFILKNLHVTKNFLSVILPYTGAGLPLGIFIISGFIVSIPRAMEEAAFIDGCGIFRTFFSILLPLIKPSLATVGVLTFLSSWNEFIMAATYIYNEKINTLPVGLMAFSGTHATDWGSMGAAMVLASIPALVFYFVFSEQVEKSFSAGALLK